MARSTLFLLFCLTGVINAQVQIMSPEDIKRVKSHLPIIEPGFIKDVINDPTSIWYDRKSMGVAYQIGAGQLFDREFALTGRLGIADAMQNISPDFPENQQPPGFGGNLRTFSHKAFPWHPKPGGTHRSPNVSSVKVLWLPKKPDGSPWSIVAFEDELEGFLSPTPTVTGFDWIAPNGAVFLEPIAINDPESKQHYMCLIRARVKSPEGYSIEIANPFPEASDLKTAIIRLKPHWRDSFELVSFISHLERDITIPFRLHDMTAGNPRFRTRRGDAFDVSARVDVLPALERGLVSELLLTTPFKFGAGYDWKTGCPAPTTDAEFHVIPQYYEGAFCGTDSQSCAKCHDSAQISARRHEDGNLLYGWGGGNKEGILSFHPFERTSLTRNPNPNVELRRTWVTAGVVAWYDPNKHPKSMYSRITHPLGAKR